MLDPDRVQALTWFQLPETSHHLEGLVPMVYP